MPTLAEATTALTSGAATLQTALQAIEANGAAWGLTPYQMAVVKYGHHALMHLGQLAEITLGATPGSIANPDGGTTKPPCPPPGG